MASQKHSLQNPTLRAITVHDFKAVSSEAGATIYDLFVKDHSKSHKAPKFKRHNVRDW